MVNNAQDLMSAKKFFDLPNKLLPNVNANTETLLAHDSLVTMNELFLNK